MNAATATTAAEKAALFALETCDRNQRRSVMRASTRSIAVTASLYMRDVTVTVGDGRGDVTLTRYTPEEARAIAAEMIAAADACEAALTKEAEA